MLYLYKILFLVVSTNCDLVICELDKKKEE